MPDRRFRCEEEYFKLCTSPYLYLTLPRTSLIITLLLLSLSLNTTLPSLPLSPTADHRFPTPFVVSSSPNKTKQTKPQHGVNNSLYSLTFNSSFLLGAGLAPYLLGILSSTPESELPPVGGLPLHTPCWQALLAGLDREPERGIGKGRVLPRGFFCRRMMRVRVTVRLLAFSVR